MKKILIIKMSSMGDVIHTLPALTEAAKLNPDIQFDWVVEESLQAIPSWHPQVKRIIPIRLRAWRKKPIQTWQQGLWQSFYQELRAHTYDCIIDAQGLIKSAVLAWLSRSSQRFGLDRCSAREWLASFAYTDCVTVPKDQHAIVRTQQLFRQALGQPSPSALSSLNYGINKAQFASQSSTHATAPVVFIHGSSRANKCWPEDNWVALAQKAHAVGLRVQLLWGSTVEKERAQRLASQCPSASVLATPTLEALASTLAQAQAVVTVDTGPGHLAAALDVPTVGLYGPTHPMRCGMRGPGRADQASSQQINLHFDPEFKQLSPDIVWGALTQLL